jgi:peptidoglycan/xylan/chitin deacetylase (PgdA/CDA1 family)
MKTIIISLLLILGNYFAITQHRVCFTIDDLPVVSYGISDTVYQEALTRRLILKLVTAKIPAIGFVNENKLYPDGNLSKFQRRLLTLWLDNGLELGNHSFSHWDYNRTPFGRFTADILKGEKNTKELVIEKKMTFKYFRHPFLHMGSTKAKADSLNDFLASQGYTIAPVTIDNDDYLFAAAYHRAGAKNDTALMAKIGAEYIGYMEKKLKFYERQSTALFGRNINHTLLLHANQLNADYIDSLAAMYRKNLYTFVSLSEALRDAAYQHEITRFGTWGISWIDRWAMSEGKKKDFFAGDPETPEYIVRLAETQ